MDRNTLRVVIVIGAGAMAVVCGAAAVLGANPVAGMGSAAWGLMAVRMAFGGR